MSQNNFTLSQSNNNEDIDKLLSPIFRTIKNKKINSYFQFQNQSTQLPSHIFTPRKPKTSKQQRKQIKKRNEIPQTANLPSRLQNQTDRVFDLQSKTDQNFSIFRKSVQRPKRKPETHQIRHRKLMSDHPVFNKKSKIKRHLIGSINFNQIENKLYKKSERITKFEHFYGELQNKKTLSKEKQLSVSFERRKESKKKEISPDIIRNYATISFRSKPRKKFWMKQKNQRMNPEQDEFIKGVSLKN